MPRSTYSSSHPETKLSARGPSRQPVHSRVELRNSRHSRDIGASKLRNLDAVASVDIDKAVHVTNAQTLDTVLRLLMPLGFETVIGQLMDSNLLKEREGLRTW